LSPREIVRIRVCMETPAEQFTAYLRMEPSSERLKAAEEKAAALLSQATERVPPTPELRRLAEHLGTERQTLLAQLRELREQFSQRRTRSSSQRAAGTKGTKP
jgi:uncharacterized protein with von Willebrand factor type A (vWA) domain